MREAKHEIRQLFQVWTKAKTYCSTTGEKNGGGIESRYDITRQQGRYCRS